MRQSGQLILLAVREQVHAGDGEHAVRVCSALQGRAHPLEVLEAVVLVNSRGFRIRYEVRGEGPAIVLLHGFPMWGDRWFVRGYVGVLEDRFRVIVPDLLGHGQSDKPHDASDYGMSNFACDVVAVLDAQGVEQAHVWGYSMGAKVAENLAVAVPDRVLSLIVGGSPPGLDQQQRLALYPPPDVPATWDDMFEGLPQPVIDLFRANNHDLGALQAIQASFCLDVTTIGDLQSAPHPTLAYIGAEDSGLEVTRRQCATLPCRLEIVPGDHAAAFAQSENVLPLALSYLEGPTPATK